MPTPSPKLGLALPSQPDDFSTADLRANWEKIDAAPGLFICTSTTRPSWGVNQAGRHIFETNTGVTRQWTGSTWQATSPEPGDIKASARSEASEGWLPCDGRVLSRTTYSHLFAAIGTSHNTGGESGTDFRIPNLVGRVIVGKDTAAGQPYSLLGERKGSATTVIAAENLPPHTHTMSHSHSIDHNHGTVVSGDQDRNHVHTGVTTNNGGHKHSVLVQNQDGNSNSTVRKAGAPGYVGEAWTTAPVSYEGDHQHTLSIGGANQGHLHSVTIPAFSGSSGTYTGSTGNGPGTGAGLSVMQPSVTLNYFIKI